MAKLLNKAPEVYREEKTRFVKDLKQFHQNRGSPFNTIPTIDGKEIDLYLLYWLVTVQGGWEKVNKQSEWEELLDNFGVPEATANGAILLKQTYLRYLDPYEKVFFLGEDEENDDSCWYNDEEESRSRRQKQQKQQSTVPLTYNHKQHDVPDEYREAAGLSTATYRKTDYDRLALSLSSPLPNEQDFGINVCTLLSNEGKHTLKLGKCARLVDLLLAHAGIFNHHSLDDYMHGACYGQSRPGYDMHDFWRSVCKDWSVKRLMLHPLSRKNQVGDEEDLERTDGKKRKSNRSNSSDSSDFSSGTSRLRQVAALAEDALRVAGHDDDHNSLFACGPKSGARELAGQRVLQVATILRNLSFEEENAGVLSKNMTCLRFCLMCTSSRWSNLNQMGFDILGNIANEIDLEMGYTESCVTDCLMSSLTTCITASDDRFQVVSSLDILTKLCQQEANEHLIGEVLTDSRSPIYDHLVKYLSLHDIHLLISTLECLYALSCLGEPTCNSITRTHGALEALVSLVTVEAQSYGPKACILMRVVETVPGASSAVTSSAPAATAVTAATVHHQQQQQAVVQQQQLLVSMQPATASVVTAPTVAVAATTAVATAAGPQQQQQQQLIQQQKQPLVLQQQQQQQLNNPTTVQNAINRSASPTVVSEQATVAPQAVQMRSGSSGQIVQIQRQQEKQPETVTSVDPPVQTVVPKSVQPAAIVNQMPNPPQPQQLLQQQQQQQPPPTQIQIQTSSQQPMSVIVSQPGGGVGGGLQQRIIVSQAQAQVAQATIKQVLPQQQQALPHQQALPQQIVQTASQQVVQLPQQQISNRPPQQVLGQQQIVQQQPQQVVQQQPQQVVQQQPQQIIQQQQQVIQPQQQQQPGSQQVQLRVSNDDANRQFCLSWLKATYENSPGSCIDQQVMYKQYLASLHKLGKRDVISGQFYCIAVRSLFGASVGPVRKQLPNGLQQNVFEGVKVRNQPLPLKVPQHMQQQFVQQAQIIQPMQQQPPLNIQQMIDNAGAAGGGVVQVSASNGSAVVAGNPNASFGGGGAGGFQIQQQQQPPTSTQIVYRANSASAPAGNNSNVPSSTTNHSPPDPSHAAAAGVVTEGGQVSPILNNLLHRKGSPAPGLPNNQEDVKPKLEDSAAVKSELADDAGGAVVNGVLPPAGKMMVNGSTPAHNGNGFLANLLQSDKKPDLTPTPIMSNGIKDETKFLVNGEAATSTTTTLVAGVKRQAEESLATISPLPKKAVLDQPSICNGIVNGNGNGSSGNGGIVTSVAMENGVVDDVIKRQALVLGRTGSPVPTMGGGGGTAALVQTQEHQIPQIIPQKQIVQTSSGQHIIVQNPQPQQQQTILTLADGKKVLVKTPVSSENGMPPATGLTVTRTPAGTATAAAAAPVVAAIGGGAVVSSTPPATAVPLGQQNKTVIILQQQNSPQQQQQQNGTSHNNAVTTTAGGRLAAMENGVGGAPAATTGQHIVVRHPSGGGGVPVNLPPGAAAPPPGGHQLPQTPAVITNATTPGRTASPSPSLSQSSASAASAPLLQTVPTSSSSSNSALADGATVQPPPNPQKPFLCEWQGCMEAFKTTKEALNHAILIHCPETIGSQDQACLWQRCDGMKRKRFSLMQHIMDRHCHPQVMKLVAVRRVQMAQSGRSDVPLPPAPPPHPGYAPNAALHAIKRHAQEFVAPKARALGDEKEGPVTKSIRLTSSLILKNLVMNSSLGRRRLRSYESHLSTVALSNVESSRTVGQILFEMNDGKDGK